MAAADTAIPAVVHTPASDTTTITTPAPIINVLLTSFAGLGLPRTLSLPVRADSSISDVVAAVAARLPPVDYRLIITTTSNKQLLSDSAEPVTALLSSSEDTFLPLRLSARLCGGKGGFGSQLRAAGGRMSSRKNRNQQGDPNGSNRNLDGRRLRTIDEAKRLAEYLAIKPEMEKKEREERKKRWEAVVEAAEKREQEIKSGKSGSNQGRLDADYVESKEDAETKVREAVMKAMREQTEMDGVDRTGSESEEDVEAGDSGEDEAESSGSSAGPEAAKVNGGGRTFFGWDDDDEDDEDNEREVNADPHLDEPVASTGKGKTRAT
jgi:hypothetical protein